MADGAIVALLFVLAALWGFVVWSVWRHRIVDDLHAIRSLLERRAQWEHELSDELHAFNRREAGNPPGAGSEGTPLPAPSPGGQEEADHDGH